MTLADLLLGRRRSGEALVYVGAQIAGGTLGVATAHTMFGLPALAVSSTERSGGGVFVGEIVATFGLVLVIFALVGAGWPKLVGPTVGIYIASASLFTSSGSFANPAVTLSRALSEGPAGIAPSSVPAFLVAQVVGAVLAAGTVAVLVPGVVPRARTRTPQTKETEEVRT